MVVLLVAAVILDGALVVEKTLLTVGFAELEASVEVEAPAFVVVVEGFDFLLQNTFWLARELMGHDSSIARASQAPEVLLAVFWMREKSLVFALKSCKIQISFPTFGLLNIAKMTLLILSISRFKEPDYLRIGLLHNKSSTYDIELAVQTTTIYGYIPEETYLVNLELATIDENLVEPSFHPPMAIRVLRSLL
ncbi:hypothetical protein HUJ04_003969 [Dendroctonus ponderosae]|nr:hypothetical protein HUJ04_003969 [Dendroctonus ponderosae]